MKNKRAISLIVLVVTIIVMGILAATVIINISNTNIIEEARKTAFKSDMANYKEAYNLYLINEYAKNPQLDESGIDIDSTTNNTDLYAELFGDKYADKLKVKDGKLIYITDDTDDDEIKEAVAELGMAEVILEPEIGDYVVYTPSSTNTTTVNMYETADYNDYDVSVGSATYYKSTGVFTQDSFKWIYIGKNSDGNMLLVADSSSTGNYLAETYVRAETSLDTLCNSLYKSDIATARNMKKEDVDNLLADTATQDIVYKVNGSNIPGYFLSTMYDNYSDTATEYSYFLYNVANAKVASLAIEQNNCMDDLTFGEDCLSTSSGSTGALSRIRPVIVLNSNVKVVEETSNGWTLEVAE